MWIYLELTQQRALCAYFSKYALSNSIVFTSPSEFNESVPNGNRWNQETTILQRKTIPWLHPWLEKLTQLRKWRADVDSYLTQIEDNVSKSCLWSWLRRDLPACRWQHCSQIKSATPLSAKMYYLKRKKNVFFIWDKLLLSDNDFTSDGA